MYVGVGSMMNLQLNFRARALYLGLICTPDVDF